MSAFIVDPIVIHPLRGYLCKNGVRAQELDDTVAEVQVRAVDALQDRKPPTDVAGWQKFLITIARNLLIDRQRETKVAEKYDTGLCDKPDEYAPFAPSGEQRDPVDARRQLAVLLHLFEAGEMPEMGREILEGVADRVKLPKLAKRAGASRGGGAGAVEAEGGVLQAARRARDAGDDGGAVRRSRSARGRWRCWGPRPPVEVPGGGPSGQGGKGGSGRVTEPSPRSGGDAARRGPAGMRRGEVGGVRGAAG